MDRIDKSGVVLDSIGAAGRQLERYCQTLAALLKKHGNELQQAFGDVVLSKDLDEDARAVAEIFVAWREAGEAQVALSTKLLAVSEQVSSELRKTKAEQTQRVAEATRLQKALKDAATKVEAPEKPRGWGAALFGTVEQPQRDEAAERKRLDSFQSATDTLLDQLVDQLGHTQTRVRGGLNDGIAEIRRHAKMFGEKLIVLRPSWKGVSGRHLSQNADGTPAAAGTKSSPAKSSPMKGSKVEGLIKSMATVEGRRRVQEEEAVEEAKTSKVVVEEAPLLAPPVEQLGPHEWRIKGVYEHQVLKAGLRQLDNEWPTKGLHEFPRNKDGSSVLFRERLFGELLAGRIPLQSVPNNDVSAAQPDIKNLSLRQLLRLRVQHIDFNPSGCGADTVMSVGDRHEAFLRTLDSKLFQSLGERATRVLTNSDVAIDTSDMHRFGREVVMLAAAAAAVKDPPWWCWWITNDRRVYFHAERFEAIGNFPDDSAGVLEITTDTSRPDKHDPTGKLRWFDWRISRAGKEAELSASPPSTAATSVAVIGETTNSLSTENAPTLAASTGSATAGMVSPALLQDLRGNLRKTDRLS